MRQKSIKMSKEYGLNASITTCAVCGKEVGVALFGDSYRDADGKKAEAPKMCCTGELCEDCKSVIDKGGHFIIEVKDGESGSNPYRTGRLVGITHDAATRIFNEEPAPIGYMEQSVFEQVFGESLK